jgi:Uma2 family endonuclease
VRSPGTRDYDRGEKFEHYRRIPSLRAVRYLSQDKRQVEIRSKHDGDWQTAVVGSGAAAVPALGVSLDVDALYAGAGA